MQKVIFIVLIFGAVIGFMFPTAEQAAPTMPATQPAATAATRSGPAVETRIRRSEDGHFYVHAMVNGQLVRFLVDTGATDVALTIEDARRVGEKIDEGSFEVVAMGASGPVRGQNLTLDSVELDGKRISNVSGMVADGLEISLLGQAYLTRMQSVQMNAEEMIIR